MIFDVLWFALITGGALLLAGGVRLVVAAVVGR